MSHTTGDAGHGRLRFRPDIEGLRAVAILMVVMYHAVPQWAGGGFFGVDVFFVLSGFLITGIMVDEIHRTGRLSVANFWARRARRLLPAAAVVTIVVLLVNPSVYSLFLQQVYANTARAFALYSSNIVFAVRSTDYFGAIATRDPLLHTWSLSVEEQFYLCFAPILLALAVTARRHGIDAFRRNLGGIIAVATVLSLLGCLALVRRYPIIAFYSLPSRAWEFGLGALVFLYQRRGDRLGSGVHESIALVSLAMLVASGILPRDGRVSALGPASLVPTLATAGLLFTGASGTPTLVARLLSTRPMGLLGRLSYSWYLWHWPALVYLHESVRAPSRELLLAVGILSLVPAAVMYALVESPVRHSVFLQRQRARYSLAGAAMLAAVALGAGTGARHYVDAQLSSPRIQAVLAARALPRIYKDGCQLPLLATESPPCEYGAPRTDTSIVLFGDSHAAHWFPAVDSVARMRGWKLVNLTKTGCPSSSVLVSNLGRQYFECNQWRAQAIARVVRMRPTIVLLSSDKTYQVMVEGGWSNPDSSVIAREEWRRGFSRTVSALSPSGALLVLLADTPQPRTDIPQCLVRYIDAPTRCDVSVELGRNPEVEAMEREEAALAGNIFYVNLNDVLCDLTTCPASKDGMIRYQDSNHLSVAYAASLAPNISAALTRALSEQVR